ncbi:MAG: response regulator [Planctomycetes bacterium]|nr:response regulator [Planctomycetota bacterium]
MARILIVDDEEILRRRLKKLLELDDHEVYLGEDARQGIEIYCQEKPDVVLMDISMPGMDGVEALKEIININEYALVIMITGHGGVDTAIEAMREGAFSYILKPVDYDQLELELSKALQKKELDQRMKEQHHHIIEQGAQLEQVIKDIDSTKTTHWTLLQTMAHTMNTILNDTIGIQDLLDRTELDKTQRKYMGILKSNSELFLWFAKELKLFSLFAGDSLKLTMKVFDINDTITSVIKHVNGHTYKNDISLDYVLVPEGQSSFCGDVSCIEHVFKGLLQAFVEMKNAGSVECVVRIENETTVRATFNEIRGECNKELLDEFNNNLKLLTHPDSCSDAVKSSSLGIVRKILTLMKGDFVLPADSSSSLLEIYFELEQVPESKRDTQYKTEIISVEPSHILIADDNQLTHIVLKSMLASLGHSVVTVSNGREAVDTLERQSFDMVILDLQMPILNGYDAARLIRARYTKDELPLIAFTASAHLHVKEKTQEAGFNDVILKPADLNQFSQLMNKYCAKSSS